MSFFFSPLFDLFGVFYTEILNDISLNMRSKIRPVQNLRGYSCLLQRRENDRSDGIIFDQPNA